MKKRTLTGIIVTGFKIHIFKPEFESGFRDDIEDRMGAYIVEAEEQVNSAFLSTLPVLVKDEPLWEKTINGIHFIIPVVNCEMYLNHLKEEAKLRRFRVGRSKKYYKIHGNLMAVILSPKDKQALEDALEAEINELATKAKAFEEELKAKTNQLADEIAKEGLELDFGKKIPHNDAKTPKPIGLGKAWN